ncbi:MAG: hypothetical protein HUJ31_12610 [Pseudomonadales bacterium]|nr:hypothetical protein [Pseudomonadales bacterium]
MLELEGLEHIPGIVEEALASVEYELSELESFVYVGDNEQDRYITIQRGVDREVMEALRDVRSERRDVEREIREREIRLIQQDGDKDRQEIRKEIETLNEKIAGIESREEELESRIKAARKEAREKREKAKAEARKVRQERQRTIENLVLQTFCDYGSTLKNLPSDEHVSIVFENSHEGDSVYVIDRADLNQCNKGADGLKASAIAYRFQPE